MNDARQELKQIAAQRDRQIAEVEKLTKANGTTVQDAAAKVDKWLAEVAAGREQMKPFMSIIVKSLAAEANDNLLTEMQRLIN